MLIGVDCTFELYAVVSLRHIFPPKNGGLSVHQNEGSLHSKSEAVKILGKK